MEEPPGEFAASARTTDKYCLRVREAPAGGSPFEVRVSNDPRKIATTVGYVRGALLRGTAERVSVNAVGQAVAKAVRIAEIVRHSVPSLHQLNRVSHVEVEDVYLPLEEGLEEVVLRRKIAVLELVLMRDPRPGERDLPGYQPPLDLAQVRPAHGGRGGYRPRIGAAESAPQSVPTVQVRPRRNPFDAVERYGRYQPSGPPRAFRNRGAPPRDAHSSSSYGFEPRGAWRGAGAFRFASGADRPPPGAFRVRGAPGPMPYYRPRVSASEPHDAF